MQVFDANGTYLRHGGPPAAPTGAYYAQFGTFGTGEGQFDNPLGIALDGLGNVIFADENNLRVQVFSPVS